jgi:hypothetical protein
MRIFRVSSVLLSFVIAICSCSANAGTRPEMRFPLLKIGTQFLTNAIVTTSNDKYVFVIHSRGMENFKVVNLSDEARELLGYAASRDGKGQTNGVTAYAKQALSAMQTEKVRAISDRFVTHIPVRLREVKPSSTMLLVLLGGLGLAYFFLAYCCALICHKTGQKPGILIWIPLLQIFPLLRAARMPPVWFLAFLVPVVNVLAQVVWSFKIVSARSKSAAVAILLLLPVTNVLAIIYLAFSGGNPEAEPERRVQVMTLEAA